MAFRVTDKLWLQTETERVKGILLMPRLWGVKWNHAKLRAELGYIGLEYSKEDIDKLNAELHNQGVVEDVVEG